MSEIADEGEPVDVMELQEQGWINVQRMAFKGWMNELFTKAGFSELIVEEMQEDLKDGVRIINFFQILSKSNLRKKWDKKPKSRIQYIQNCYLALHHMEEKMIPNPGISAEEIVDQNEKLLLGLLWVLFKKYRIADLFESDKAEDGLLDWVKEQTEEFENISINAWRDSFSDGLVWGAICQKFAATFETETSIDVSTMSSDNAKENLTTVFEKATSELGIPQLLNVDEVVSKSIDQRSVVLYTSLFFHAFIAKQEALTSEREAREKEEAIRAEKEAGEMLESTNEELHREETELVQALTISTAARDELIEKKKKLEEELEFLDEDIKEIGDAKAQLENFNAKLEEDTAQVRQQIDKTEGVQEQGEKDLAELLHSTGKEAKSLLEMHATLEVECGEIKLEIENLKSKLAKESKERKAKEGIAKVDKEREAVQFSGLDILEKTLPVHLQDIHTWRSYLEYEKNYEIVQPKAVEIPKNDDFVQRLVELSKHLQEENDRMLQVLKDKEAEQVIAAMKQKKKEQKKKAKKN